MTPVRGRLLPVACAAIMLVGLGFGLSGYPLLDPDEGRNAEIAREMAVSNDYLLPRLNQLPYVDKPVLYFAAVAASMELFGTTVAAARLPSLLFTLCTLAVIWFFARRVWSQNVAWIAAVATATSPLTIAFARTVIMDSALTFLVVVALVAFYIAVEKADGRTGRRADGQTNHETPVGSNARIGPLPVSPSARLSVAGPGWWPAVAWGAIALGVLTKGPIALGLPLMVALPYVVWRRAWKVLLDPVGLLLFLAIVLPWIRAMSQRIPDYLEYVLVTETLHRLTTPALQRTGPWWYFLPILLAGALPWSVMALASLRRSSGWADRRTVFLLLWILVPLIFFSLSQSKRPQYVLPIVPAVGLLAAASWSERSVRVGSLALGGFGALLLAIYSSLPSIIRNVSPGIAEAIPATAIVLSIVCVLASGGAFVLRRSRAGALLALALPAGAIPLVSGRLMNEIGNERSANALAQAIQPVMVDATEIVGVGAYPPSLPFYLGRTLTISTDSARELTSNYIVRYRDVWADVPGSPLRPARWWQEAAIECERPRVFIIRAEDDAALQFLTGRVSPVAQAGKYAAFGPCGLGALAEAAAGERRPAPPSAPLCRPLPPSAALSRLGLETVWAATGRCRG